MANRQFDLALWRSPSSWWPEVIQVRAVDSWTLPYEAVQALMQEQGETYVYKAVVNIGSCSLRRYWHMKVPGSKTEQE